MSDKDKKIIQFVLHLLTFTAGAAAGVCIYQHDFLTMFVMIGVAAGSILLEECVL